jgi:TIR domain
MSESRQTKVTRIEILKAAIQRLFGYDFFISYAWYDGRPYAEALVRRLALKPYGYRCFIDQKEMGGGEAWRTSIRKALRRTSVMVLVASPAALASDNVFEEVRTFSARQRPLIPISFASGIAQLPPEHRLHPFLDERLRVGEQDGLQPLKLGEPADNVLTFLDYSFGFVRVSRWRTIILTGAVLVFAAIAGFATDRLFAERREHALAESRLRINTAQRLAAEAGRVREEASQRSLLLAVEAHYVTRQEHEPPVPEARTALLRSLDGFGDWPLAGHTTQVRTVQFSPDSRWAVSSSRMRSACGSSTPLIPRPAPSRCADSTRGSMP